MEFGVVSVEFVVVVYVVVVYYGYDYGGGVDGVVGVEDGYRCGVVDYEGVVLVV